MQNEQLKDRIYAKYLSTHIIPRKGSPTISEFKSRAIIYSKHFRRFLPQNKNSKIIDVGCGNGSVVWWLQYLGYTNAEGIDVSSEQIEIGKKLGVNNIKQADLTKFFQETSVPYDVIILRNVIEHLKKDEIVQVLDVCCRFLTNNGTVIIQAPNAESPFGGRIRYGDFTHEIAFTVSSLSQVLRIAGFNIIHFYPVNPIIQGPKSVVQSILWKIVALCYRFLLYVELGSGKRVVTQDIIAVAWKNNGACYAK